MTEFDFNKMLSIVFKHMPLFLLIVFLVMLTGGIHVSLKTPQYEVSSLIHIKENKEKETGIAELMGTSTQKIQNEIEIFRSNSILATLTEKAHLRIKFSKTSNYYFLHVLKSLTDSELYLGGPDILNGYDTLLGEEGIITKEKNSYTITFNDSDEKWNCRWDKPCNTDRGEITLARKGVISPGSKFTFSSRSMQKSIESLKNSLNFSTAGDRKNPELLRISYTNSNPHIASDIVNQLVSIYAEKKKIWSSREAEATEDFLEEIVDNLSLRLKKERNELSNFQRKEGAIIPEKQVESFMKQTESLRNQIRESEVKIDILRGIIKKSSDFSENNPLPSPAFVQDTALTETINKYNALVLERVSMASGVTSSHPMMIEISRKISETASTISQLSENIIFTLGSELKGLKREYGKLTKEISNFPENVIKLSSLSTDVKITEQIYTFLLQKLYEAGIRKGGALSGVIVVDNAGSEFSQKTSPRGKLYLIIISILALLTGTVLIFVRELLKTVATSPEEIEEFFPDIPIFAKIPHMEPEERQNNELQWKEIFRHLHANISFSTTEEKQIIAISSSVPSEGKSFLLYQLAEACRQFDENVIIVDGDMRKPTQHIHNSISRSPGLTDYLTTNEISIDEVVKKTSYGYDVIPAGEEPPNPPLLLKSKKFSLLLKKLKEKYDFVLVDLPPVFAVTDPVFMAEKLDVLIFVTKIGTAPLAALNNIEKDMFMKIPEKKRNVGLVINGIKKSFLNNIKYGNYNSGYYGFQYKYGTENKQKKTKNIFKKKK
ncbi:MAG: polysaccharide biosynthesis tyrosine autokinase [bacterium]